MVIKHRIGKKCPHCGEILALTVNEEHHVEYHCEKCGYEEVDERSTDVDVRRAPTFHTLPVIKI